MCVLAFYHLAVAVPAVRSLSLLCCCCSCCCCCCHLWLLFFVVVVGAIGAYRSLWSLLLLLFSVVVVVAVVLLLLSPLCCVLCSWLVLFGCHVDHSSVHRLIHHHVCCHMCGQLSVSLDCLVPSHGAIVPSLPGPGRLDKPVLDGPENIVQKFVIAVFVLAFFLLLFFVTLRSDTDNRLPNHHALLCH